MKTPAIRPRCNVNTVIGELVVGDVCWVTLKAENGVNAVFSPADAVRIGRALVERYGNHADES